MWLYLPPSCRSARVMPVSTSDSVSLSQRLAPSVSWKGKLLPRRSWLRVLKTAPSTRLLFGRICGRSMAARGAALWISSLRATRASRSRSRASGAAGAIRGTSGRRSHASSVSASPSGSSSKTSPATSRLDFAQSLASYNAWVIASRQDSLRRRKSALRTGASGCLPWPTARAEDAESCGNHPNRRGDSLTGVARSWKTPHGLSATDRNGKTAGGGGEFARQALAWQTPATDSFRSRSGARKAEPGLDQQARQWRTPDAPTSGGVRTRTGSDRKGHQVLLATQAAEWPTPVAQHQPRGKNFTKSDGHYKPHDLSTAVASHPSAQVPTSTKLGASSSTSAPKLNPLFVESLMGLPLGWTALEHLETASFRSWLRTHTEAFERLSLAEVAIGASA